MTGSPERPSVEDVLAHARKDFLILADSSLTRIEQLAASLDATAATEQLEGVRQELHKLQGSAGTFGYPRITRQAAAASLVIRRWRTSATVAARGPVLLHVVAAMREDLALPPGEPSHDTRRVLLHTAGDEAATDLAIAALSAGLVVERVFKGELSDAMEEGAPLAVLTGDDAASARPDAIVAELIARRASGA